MIRRAHATSWRDWRHARSRRCPAKMCTPQKKPWGDSRRRLSGGAKPDVLSVVTMLLAVALTSACRIDMHVQPRVNPLAKSDFFPDQRGARPLVEGTVARGQLHEDSYFYTGKNGNTPGDYMPFPVTREALRSEEHTSELQSRRDLVCRLLLEKK